MFEKPERPAVPPVVERWHELKTSFDRQRQALNSISLTSHDSTTPNPALIGSTEPERWYWSDSTPNVHFSQAERLAIFESRVLADIDELTRALDTARELAEYFTAHEAEIHAYERAVDEWREACHEVERLKHEHENELWLDEQRQKYEVGYILRPARARNAWEIIARNGKGGVIRERRYDDKPARLREVADILEVA